MLDKKVVGFVYVIVSAVCFSSKGVLIKLAYGEEIDPVSLLTFRMLFSFPFYIAIFFVYKPAFNETHPNYKDYLLTIFLGLIGYYFASYMDFEGLKYVSAGMERLILFIYPTITALLAVIFYKKKIMKPMIISLSLTYLGVVLVVAYDLTLKGTESLPGMVFIFISALAFSVYLVFSDKLVHKFGSIRYTTYIMLASCFGVFVHYFFIHSIEDLFKYSSNIYLISMVLAVLGTVIPSYLMTDGIKKIGARNTAITATLGPVWTIILANTFLDESINLVQMTGTALIVGGVLVLNLSKNQE